MKKVNWWWIACTLVSLLFSFVVWRYPLPSGVESVSITGALLIVTLLSTNIYLSYLSLVIVGVVMLAINLNSSWVLLPFLIDMVVLSIILRWHTPLGFHMNHSQAINFGMIGGLCQLVGMVIVVGIQTLLMTSQWEEFRAIIIMSLPAALLNALLDCLLIPPLTLFVRHYTEQVVKKNE